ncbi:MAG: PHB depolymerase family esterase, partial [Bacteroidota bacterium]
SAGAAMAAVMMATYPDVFASGAINAGLPYKAATSLISAFSAMNPGNNQSPNQWGNLVRNAYSHSGDYPRVAILHGTSDFTVNNANATELVDQWTNVLGIDQTADADDASFEGNGAVRRRDYEDGSGNTLVVRYDFNGMGHAIAIDPGSGATQGGNSGSFTADVNFFSSYWSAEFFGLTGSTPPGGGGGGSTPIATPTNLAAIAQGEDAIDLSWTDNASNETAYRVERSANGSGPFATIANLGANASSYSDTGLMASTTYFYRVVASNGTDPEGISAVASETTNAAAGGGGGGGGGATITIEQTSGPWRLGFLSTDDFGQSFTATADGLLNQVDFLLAASTSNSTLHMYAGNTVSGTPIYSQTGVSTGSGWQSIALSTPLAVVNGQVYTVQLTNSSVKYTSSNAYSGGSYWYNSINYTVFDGAFRVYIETNAARPGLNTSEFGEALAFQVYPNPATDRIRLGGLEQAHSILLLDALGRQVMKVTPEESTTEMQVSHLRPGIYWLQVHQGTQVLSQRIAIH